jgi:hypothetical protein
MSTFDAANPNACTAKRPETTVPQQTLFALNSEFIQDRASRLAAITKHTQPATDEDRIVGMVRRALCRTPTESEVGQAKKFLSEAIPATTTADGAAVDPERRWILLAHALMASNEFTFLD